MSSLYKDKRYINSVIWKCRQGYGNLFGGKDPDYGLTSGFSTMTMPLHMMRSRVPGKELHYKNGLSILLT